jgi:endonuclease/exonuclease/phosphatase family metal-dependent hydrolase
MRIHLRGTLLATAAFLALSLIVSPFPAPAADAGPTYLLCFWNVENFFDDRDDNRPGDADRVFDKWFARDSKMFQLKLDNLAKAIAKMNGGKGPDILVLAEVESQRAAELLRDAIHKELNKPELEYKHVVFRDHGGLRVIANAVLSRVPIEARKTVMLGNKQRILETHLIVNDHDLTLIASHWTARVSDARGEARERYAERIHDRYKSLRAKNPDLDFLVCGDFNDDPTDESVSKFLWATDDREAVKKPNSPHLFNPFLEKFKGKDADRFGTHNHLGKWHTFDQIVVSPGMLDRKGWWCDPDKVQAVQDLTADDKGRPLPFGSERFGGKRGWSDHFPVTIPLQVQGK